MDDKKETKLGMGNLYDINKNLMSREKNLKHFEIKDKIREICKKIKESSLSYYCLLCRELYDFTIFNFSGFPYEKFDSAFFECLINRGAIKDIQEKEDSPGTYEIWIEHEESKETYLYYFFPYETGVLEVSL